MSNMSTPNSVQDTNDIINNEEGQSRISPVLGETNSTGGQEEDPNAYGKKKRQKTSSAWANFKVVSTPNGDEAECKNCGQRLSINKSGVTSHLNRHALQTCPKKSLHKGQQTLSITTTLTEAETVRSVQNFKYDQAKMREVISHMIMIHELPFSFVEYDLFNLVMKTASPHYQSFSRTTAKKDCMATYNVEKKKVMAALSEVNRVSVTTDKKKKLLNEAELDEGSYMGEMISKMNQKFEKYWGDCNLLMAIAAVLDPRYKMKLIEWCYPDIYSEAVAKNHITTTSQTLRSLYKEYVEAHNAQVEKSVQNDSQIECSSIVSVPGKGKAKVIAQFSSYIKNVDSVEKVKSELEVYLEEGVVIWEEEKEFEVLSWWRTNNLKFRILSKMACDVLAIPITYVASESTFSAGGRVIDPYRANLGVDTVQALLCGEDWLRARYGIKRKEKETSIIQEIHLS